MCIPAASAPPSTARPTGRGRRRRWRGFTLIELLVVMALIALLASLVTPMAGNAIRRAREATLRENLYVTRKALDDYYADHARYPDDLRTLVEQRYLRNLPLDPVTGRKDTWVLERERTEDAGPGGIRDLRSGSGEIAADGTPYGEW